MLVTRQSLDAVISDLQASLDLGLDTETTGTMQSDRLFSLIVTNENHSYYFNFKPYPGLDADLCLDREGTFEQLNKRIFGDAQRTYYIHNAKFDLRMLIKETGEIAGKVHCTYAVERVLRNNYFGKKAYKLEGLAERRGLQKDNAVEEYISKHRLYTKTKMPGKKKEIQLKHFDQVPFEIISKYGMMDGHLHRTIGLDQLKQLAELEASRPAGFPSYYPVVENEIRLTKTCFRMEQRGIKIDKPYVAKALEYEMDNINRLEKQFLELTGEPFVDSNKPLALIFDRLGEKYPTTDKGNPSFKAEVLEDMDTPVASVINQIRYHDKRAGTYYSSFLFFGGEEGVIHANAKQAGTETGRMSYSDPNLQNVPKEDDEEDLAIPYHVRTSFIPRPGHFFYAIDYRQQEFRMMLDYAGEMELINDINSGADVHEATARLCGITRRQAKTINFGLLYGMGIDKLARSLGVPVEQAKELKRVYFAKLPRVQKFIKQVVGAGESRGYIFNWAGRRNHIAQRDWAYILPNHIIQGGCADTIKFAMNAIDDLLIEKKSPTKMLLQVHDELLFECPFGDERIVEDITRIMESIYKPQNGMRLDVSVEHSFKSWGARDKIKGTPYGAGK